MVYICCHCNIQIDGKSFPPFFCSSFLQYQITTLVLVIVYLRFNAFTLPFCPVLSSYDYFTDIWCSNGSTDLEWLLLQYVLALTLVLSIVDIPSVCIFWLSRSKSVYWTLSGMRKFLFCCLFLFAEFSVVSGTLPTFSCHSVG